LFLPVILVGLALWFGYDGFINDDPEMLDHLIFNQVGFAILSVLSVWFGYKGVKEWKQTQGRRADSPDDQDSDAGRPPPIG
jgi:membrane protein implicated in regulation of membrane protease activity